MLRPYKHICQTQMHPIFLTAMSILFLSCCTWEFHLWGGQDAHPTIFLLFKINEFKNITA
jgi:hypothetical protein